MTLAKIAIRNLMRRKAKAGFLLLGLVIGVATATAVFSMVEAMTMDINHKLEKYGANILVLPRAESLGLSYGGLSLGGVPFDVEEIREQDLVRIDAIPNAANVAAVGPITLGVVPVAGRRLLLAGVDFAAAGILKPWWHLDGDFPGADGVLLGAEAAGTLDLGTGDSLTVAGRQLRVSGILSPTGSQDDELLFTRLSTAQQILNKPGKVSMVEVAALCTACPVEEMVRQIAEVLPNARVSAIQQVVKGRMETLAQFGRLSYGISAVVLMIGALVVLVTMMGNVRERTEEIGIFRALGFRSSHVLKIVLMEAAAVSAMAGILGYAAGIGATHFAVRLLSGGHPVAVSIRPEMAGAAIALAVILGLCASLYPAVTAARLDPNEALRTL
ncbi:MAG: ABC transporter permease [Desulfobacterales bacterium]|nr:ABC transporter permease [Desulfobacterales bacterium]